MSDVAVFDLDKSTSNSLANKINVKVFDNIENAIDWQPDGVIIATPPKSHINIASLIISHGIDLLIEKPLSNNYNIAKKFVKDIGSVKSKIFVVCNMRFHPAVELIKKNIDKIGNPLFSRVHVGNYLPNMRKNIDYRKLYVADSQEGGVVLDGIHEIDYISWILGPIKSQLSVSDRISNLEISAEDYAAIIFQHSNGVRTELHLDYLRKVKRRGAEFVGSDGLIDWLSEGKNPETCKLRLFTEKNGWEILLESDNLDINLAYNKLIQDFIKSIEGENSSLQTAQEGLNALELALNIRMGD
tara:strand:- start:2087 stop:2986 length:900 start_codon:yes stop_codon:yes gene_type:complete